MSSNENFFTDDPDIQGGIAIGQSVRLTGDSPFPDGSGLEDSLSDVVGQLDLSPADFLDLVYRFQYDVDDAEMDRQEVSLRAGVPELNLSATYVSLQEERPDLGFGKREEVRGTLRTRFSDFWGAYVGARHDIDEEGMARRHHLVHLLGDELPRGGGQLQLHYFASRILAAFSCASSMPPTM